jgi:phosphotransferase system HPr (HPr) family protein
MLQKTIIMRFPSGLHLRPASRLVELSKQYRADVMISCSGNCGNCRRADGCSIIQLLLLRAKPGDPVTIIADGPDEDEAVTAISRLLSGS